MQLSTILMFGVGLAAIAYASGAASRRILVAKLPSTKAQEYLRTPFKMADLVVSVAYGAMYALAAHGLKLSFMGGVWMLALAVVICLTSEVLLVLGALRGS